MGSLVALVLAVGCVLAGGAVLLQTWNLDGVTRTERAVGRVVGVVAAVAGLLGGALFVGIWVGG